MRTLTITAYIAAIVAANVITAATTPADIGPFLVTWGTWIVGVTFILRDLMQLAIGRAWSYAVISIALVISAATSAVLGDTLAIVTGSAVAFAVSEALDTEIFTRLKTRIPARIAVSGATAGVLDSAIFAVIGLSPLWSGIVPWSALPNLIIGQVLAKALVQGIAAGIYSTTKAPRVVPEPAS
jgi:uncharacterized PurR-regulated membrane protein YhhQ (DUF165 family)